MKAVVILVLVAVMMLNGCGGSSATVQAASGTVWQAQLTGGSGAASGLSFITTFTINGNGSLTIPSSDFQFLNLNQGSCFPVTGDDASGSIMNLQVDPTTGEVTANFSFTVQGNGNTLTLMGPLTGTETGIVTGTSNNTGTFTTASVTGTWTLTGADKCNAGPTGTSFTMTLCTTSTTCSTP